MPDRASLDGDVLVYLYSEDETEKAQQALQCAQGADS